MSTVKTEIQWAVVCSKEVLEYDDEEDARAHLPFHLDGYLVRREVTCTPWERVP